MTIEFDELEIKKCVYCEYEYTSRTNGYCKNCEDEIKSEIKGEL